MLRVTATSGFQQQSSRLAGTVARGRHDNEIHTCHYPNLWHYASNQYQHRSRSFYRLHHVVLYW